jgi:hypothetical protein
MADAAGSLAGMDGIFSLSDEIVLESGHYYSLVFEEKFSDNAA